MYRSNLTHENLEKKTYWRMAFVMFELQFISGNATQKLIVLALAITDLNRMSTCWSQEVLAILEITLLWWSCHTRFSFNEIGQIFSAYFLDKFLIRKKQTKTKFLSESLGNSNKYRILSDRLNNRCRCNPLKILPDCLAFSLERSAPRCRASRHCLPSFSSRVSLNLSNDWRLPNE